MLDMSDVTITCTKVSPRKIEANRANAKKSTGPRTMRGKAASSRNAIKLGIFSAGEAFVMGEDEPEHNYHRIEMLRSLNPANAIQLRFAGLIIAASWNINRISWAERQEHFWTIELQRREHEKKCKKERRKRDYDGLPEQKDPRFKKPTEWVQTLLLLAGEGSPATRFERLEKFRMQLEMSMNRNLNQLRKLKKDTGGTWDETKPTELTLRTIARWERECEVCDPDAEDEEKTTEKPKAPEAVEEPNPSASARESASDEMSMLQNVAPKDEKSKTNPPISEPLAGPGVGDVPCAREHTVGEGVPRRSRGLLEEVALNHRAVTAIVSIDASAAKQPAKWDFDEPERQT